MLLPSTDYSRLKRRLLSLHNPSLTRRLLPLLFAHRATAATESGSTPIQAELYPDMLFDINTWIKTLSDACKALISVSTPPIPILPFGREPSPFPPRASPAGFHRPADIPIPRSQFSPSRLRTQAPCSLPTSSAPALSLCSRKRVEMMCVSRRLSLPVQQSLWSRARSSGAISQELIFGFLFWGCITGVLVSKALHLALPLGQTRASEGNRDQKVGG